MRIGVFIHKTPHMTRVTHIALFRQMEDLMRAGIHTSGNVEDEACDLINPITLPEHADARREKLATNPSLPRCDAVLVVVPRLTAEDRTDFTNDLYTAKNANPDTLFATVLLHDDQQTDQTAGLSDSFSALAGGSDVVYALTPQEKKRTLRSLIHAVRDGTLPRGVTSPSLMTPAPEPVLTLGDITIDRNRRIATLPDGKPVSLLPQQADILGFVAAYRGSYLDRDTLLSFLYGTQDNNARRADNKIIDVQFSQIVRTFNALGMAGPRNVWGVGRIVNDDDFRLPDKTPHAGPQTRQTTPLPFTHDRQRAVLLLPDTRRISLSPSQNALLSVLMDNGTKLSSHATLRNALPGNRDHAHTTLQIYMSELRKKLAHACGDEAPQIKVVAKRGYFLD